MLGRPKLAAGATGPGTWTTTATITRVVVRRRTLVLVELVGGGAVGVGVCATRATT
jgi:hypothetical protein